jgi:hypothetical protein
MKPAAKPVETSKLTLACIKIIKRVGRTVAGKPVDPEIQSATRRK